MPRDSRDRMIHSAYELFRERGFAGTGLREINAHSGVARGAIYHHFPGGKDELAGAVIEHAGQQISGLLGPFAAEAGPVAAVEAFAAGWEQHLEDHEFCAGCAIAAVAAETPPGTPTADTAAAAFGDWIKILAKSLRGDGVPRAQADRLATLAVSAVEGAVLLCRSEASTKRMVAVRKELAVAFDAAVQAARAAAEQHPETATEGAA